MLYHISKYYQHLFLDYQVKHKLSQCSKKTKDIHVLQLFKELDRNDLVYLYTHLHPLLQTNIKLKMIKYICCYGL